MSEHLEGLAARVMALEVAVRIVLRHAGPEVRDKISVASVSAVDRGLFSDLTDEQISDVQRILETVGRLEDE